MSRRRTGSHVGMIEQPFNAWRLSLKQETGSRLVLVLNLREAKRTGLPEAFFDEIAAFLAGFDDVQGSWTRAGPYEFAVCPVVSERSALEFTMRLRTGVRTRYYAHAARLNLPDLDQVKAIQPFTWPQRKAELNEALRGLLEVAAGDGGWRALSMSDVAALRDLLPAIADEEWLSRIMAHQTAVVLDQDGNAQPWVTEHYCRISQVRQLIDPGIDLRGNDLMFALLLGALDLKVLETAQLWTNGGHWSINLSVNTLLSRDFTTFADLVPIKGGMVEIKQSDLMLQYHRGLKAIAMLREAGVSVAIDLVWPDSLGLVDYLRIPGISAVKIPHQQAQGDRLVAEKPTLRRYLDAGIVPVLSRVGEAAGLEAGLKAGVRVFQGKYVSQTFLATAEAAD